MPRQTLTVGAAKVPSAPTYPPAQLASTAPSIPSSLPTAELQRACEEWFLDCEYRLQSPRTIETRRVFLKNLLWFLEHRGFAECDTRELKQFFYYLRHGHEEKGGRWNNKQLKTSVRPETVKDYWVCLSTFFKWLVADGITPASLMGAISKPVVRAEEKQPLTSDQVKGLLKAAKTSQHPQRDEAIVLLVLDTGMRSSELIALKVKDVDLRAHHCVVTGKGNKDPHRPFRFHDGERFVSLSASLRLLTLAFRRPHEQPSLYRQYLEPVRPISCGEHSQFSGCAMAPISSRFKRCSDTQTCA